jgi:hypothetical protein
LSLFVVACSLATLSMSACSSAAVRDAGATSAAVRGAAARCHRVAAPTGRDHAAGTAAHPFRTVSRLIRSLQPGQTGCLRKGRYGGPRTKIDFWRHGITIRSYPGERATIQGWPYISGAGTTLSHLNFDLNNVGHTTSHCAESGGRSPSAYSLQIETSDVTIEHDNIFQNDVPLTERAGAIGVGFNTSDSHIVVRYNRIHDVGWCPVEDHGVYLDHVSGAGVYDNWIYDIPGGTGVQLWSTTTNAHVYANVIDQAASGFTLGCCAKEGEVPTHGNAFEHNVVTNNVGIPFANLDPVAPTGFDPGVTVWTYWSGTPGAGNVYRDNLAYCTSGFTHCGTSPGPTAGLAYSNDRVGNPQFVNPAAHDYRVRSRSPVAAWHLWDGDLGPIRRHR